MFRSSIFVPDSLWEQCRAAYWAWVMDDPGEAPESIQAWVERCVWWHLERDVEQRRLAASFSGLEGLYGGPKSSRPIVLSTQADQALRLARATELLNGARLSSAKAFINEALGLGVCSIRARLGELPPAPAQLPIHWKAAYEQHGVRPHPA